MSRPKPPPPPRPDLEGQSSVDDEQTKVTPDNVLHVPPKPTRAVPPPIPLRPDLGEGVDDNVHVPSIAAPKIPPPVLEKKASHTKFRGRPEITIISAQPMTTPGFVSPPAPATTVHSQRNSHPTTSPVVKRPPTPATAVHSQPTTTPGVKSPPRPATTVPSQPMTTPSRPSPTIPPPTIPSKSTSPFLPSPSSTGSPSPNKAQKTPKSREPPQRPKSKPVFELPVGGEEAQRSVGILNASIIEKQEESPKAPKRKKNKPNKNNASFGNDFDSGFGINNSAFFENGADRQEDVKMKNNEVNETVTSTKTKSSPTVIRTKPNGKDICTTQDPFQQFDNSKTEDTRQVKTAKPTVIQPPVKLKPPPTSLKKPSPKEVDNTGIPRPVTPTSPSQPEIPSAKPKSRPTVIIPKAKKDSGNRSENVENKTDELRNMASPSDKPVLETQTSDIQDKKPGKTKRIPSIIRPNRLKKDTTNSQGDSVAMGESFRGTPEGESQESSQNQIRKGPVRKAPPPPRPSPPKPAPARPGAPKRTSNEPKALIESANQSVKFEAHSRPPPSGTKAEQVTETHVPENKRKAKHPRPATIGKDKESEDRKTTEMTKKKEETKKSSVPTVSSVIPTVSSVVTTKIEPSAIALYDYIPTSIEDLSFKAGDEIFLVKRVDREWYIGRCGDCEGMMPVKFVEIIEDLPPEPKEALQKASHNTTISLSTIALYDFHGQSNDELTLHAGDKVHLLEIVNDEWIKGQSNGNIGIFPANFIDISEDMKHELFQQKQISKPPKLNNNSQENFMKETFVSPGPRCKALYDYDSGNPDDLRFSNGDAIQIIERIDAEWLKGKIHGATGMFPAAYVEIIEDLNLTSAKHASNFPVTKALHEYVSHAEGDLSFNEGDMITIVGKVNEDWLEGELHGQRGMLPSTYVEHVEFSGSSQHAVPDHQKPQDHLLPKGKALYDFTAETEHELNFKVGDEIILLKHINEEWMEGELNNHIGQFPVAFIEILVPFP